MLSQTVYIASTSRIKRTMLIENIVCEKCNNYLYSLVPGAGIEPARSLPTEGF